MCCICLLVMLVIVLGVVILLDCAKDCEQGLQCQLLD